MIFLKKQLIDQIIITKLILSKNFINLLKNKITYQLIIKNNNKVKIIFKNNKPIF